jgi:hypothetical protein
MDGMLEPPSKRQKIEAEEDEEDDPADPATLPKVRLKFYAFSVNTFSHRRALRPNF